MYQHYLRMFDFTQEEANRATTLGFCDYLEGFTQGILAVTPYGLTTEEFIKLCNKRNETMEHIKKTRERIQNEYKYI